MNLKSTSPQMDEFIPKDDKKIIVSIGGRDHPKGVIEKLSSPQVPGPP